LFFISGESLKNAQTHIQAIFKIYQERFPDASSSSSTTSINAFRQYFTQLRQDTNELPSPLYSSTITELDRYLALQIDEETDPLLWWQAHAKEYPIVSNMARDYLTIQATSVASEQAFSVACNVISKTRNRLLPETARACLCMKSWITNKLGE